VTSAQILPALGLPNGSAVLAQFGPSPGEVDPLPGPPISSWMLFEQPWYLAGALIVLGIVSLWWLRKQEATRTGIALALVIVALGLVVGITGTRVDTDREVVMARTGALVEAIASPDPNQLDLLLGEEGGVVVDRGRIEFVRNEVLDHVRSAHASQGRYSAAGVGFRIESYRIRTMRAQVLSPVYAKSQVNIVGELDGGLLMPASWWEIDWERDRASEPWRASLVEALWIQGR